LIYLLIVLYVTTPPVCYYAFRYRKHLFPAAPENFLKIFQYSLFIPLTFYLGLSSIKSIGLHWLLAFVPFAFILLGASLPAQPLAKVLRFEILFSGLHLLIALLVISLPLTTWKSLGFNGEDYARLVFFFKHAAIRQALKDYNQDYIFASYSYAIADLMHYDSKINALAFGLGSAHGRQGDLLTDFKNYQEKNFIFLDTSYPDLKIYQPYFASIEVKSLPYKEANFYYILGHRFNYTRYREQVLKAIYLSYWQVPKWLPIKQNFYASKYHFSKN
jgi:hypothetical protein